jgi:predicted HTH transcriptional regulator
MKTVLMGVVIMISGAILMVYLFRRYSQSVSPHPSEGMAKESSGSSLLRMISAGENSTQEFKSTLRTNLKTDKPDKAIELAWLKSVTAFMNSEGGTLLVGINDESNIEGIEADGFENQDKCRLHVKNLINQHIGAEFSRHIDCNLQIVNGKTIVVITCEKATDPVFLKVGKNEDFFIRSGPSSIKLSMSKMVQYLKQR